MYIGCRKGGVGNYAKSAGKHSTGAHGDVATLAAEFCGSSE